MIKTDITVGKRAVYVDSLSLRIGSKGKPVPAGEAFGTIPTRGERKRLRKALNRAGFVDVSAVPTIFKGA